MRLHGLLVTTRRSAISALERPSATSRSTSISRGVSSLEALRPGGELGPKAGELVDQPARDRGRKQRLAGRDDAYGLEEVLGGDVLEQEAAGARAERVVDVFVEVEVVSIRTRVRASPSLVIFRVASMPSRPGMRTSISTTSGRSRPADADRLLPSAARMRRPSCRAAWRGARRTLAHDLLVVGDDDADAHAGSPVGSSARTAKPPPSRRAGLERAAHHLCPLAHAGKAVPVGLRFGRRARCREPRGGACRSRSEARGRRRRRGVPAGVGQRLLERCGKRSDRPRGRGTPRAPGLVRRTVVPASRASPTSVSRSASPGCGARSASAPGVFAQQTEQAAQLDEGVPRGVSDRLETPLPSSGYPEWSDGRSRPGRRSSTRGARRCRVTRGRSAPAPPSARGRAAPRRARRPPGRAAGARPRARARRRSLREEQLVARENVLRERRDHVDEERQREERRPSAPVASATR